MPALPTTPLRRRPLMVGALAAVAGVVLAACGGSPAEVTHDGPTGSAATTGSPEWNRAGSQVLSEAAGGAVVLVEFMDYECPSCRAFYPLMEQLVQEYSADVTFVVRNFPLDMHPNAYPAAWAAEAAAEQGRFADMYSALFVNQDQWSGQDESMAPNFRDLAEQLGLDMEQYDRDVVSATVRDRVAQDRQDALDLGLTGTPSFILSGEVISPESEEEFRQLLDQAIAAP